MKKHLFYLLCFFTGALFAQPVITDTDLLGVGDIVITQPTTTETFNPGPAGANQTWDFSQIVSDGDPDTTFYISPVGTPYAASYPSSNIVGFFDGNSYGYYQTSGGKLFYWGSTDPMTALVLTDPATYFVSPATYGTFVLDTIAGTLNLGPISGSVVGQVYFEGDGYGTLQLPTGTYTDVLRIKTVTAAVATVPFLGTIIDSVFNYSWYKLGTESPLLEMIEDTQWSGGTVLDQTRYINYFQTITSGSSDLLPDRLPVSIYPNPADAGQIRFVGLSGPTRLVIQNAAGQRVLEETVTPGDPVSIKKLGTGVYFCSLYTNRNQVQTVKLVVH
jgi:hypothetical protein